MAESLVVLLGRAEAAERLRVSERTVRRYGKSGLLDARRVGPKLVKITEASVDALMAKRNVAA
jgi:excisionase family DNA binding protein